MIRFIYGKDEEIGAFAAKLIPGAARGFGAGIKTIGVIDEQGRFLAGIVYHHWSPEAGTIVMSAAATKAHWLTRPVLQRIFDYPFDECGCQMLIMQLSARDLRLQYQLAIGGFAFNRIRRLYGRGHDGIVATLTEEDWRACRFNRRPVVTIEEAA